jgi:hypothetical protein
MLQRLLIELMKISIIQLSTPFRKLNYVELVENIMLPQQEAIEQQAMQENGSDNP